MKPWKTLGEVIFCFGDSTFLVGGLIFVWEDYFVFVCLRQGLCNPSYPETQADLELTDLLVLGLKAMWTPFSIVVLSF